MAYKNPPAKCCIEQYYDLYLRHKICALQQIIIRKMIISRDKYLQQLIVAKGNGMVKIVTGIRRSGKSFLLMNLFHQHLIENGVQENHIIELSMDNRRNKRLRNPDALLDFIDDKIQPDGQVHYVILDEV